MNRVLLIPTLLLALLFVVAFSLSGGTLPTQRGDARPLVFADDGPVRTLDFAKSSWAIDLRLAMGLFEGLVSYKPADLSILPGVAERWEISADGKTYTFFLRGDAKWSNGDAVTSRDFMFAWQRMLTPVTAAEYASLFFPIAGAEEYFNTLGRGEAADFAKVGVSAPDERTLVVKLASPCTYFLSLAAFPPFYPMHAESMRPFLVDASDLSKGYRNEWARPPHLVSNGPFYLKDWKFERHLQLVANPHYWDAGNVGSKEIRVVSYTDPRAAILAFESGAVDALSFVPDGFGEQLLKQKREGKRNNVHYRPVFGTYYFLFNCTRKPLDDARVRRALSLVIDKKQITENVLRMGQATTKSLVPADSVPGYTSPAGLEMNVEEAKRLLAEAGYPGGAGMRAIEMLYASEPPHHGKTAQVIAQAWKRHLNVETTLRAVDQASFRSDRKSANFDVARGGWYGDYTDPTTWLDLLRTSDGNNDGKYSNPAYDALLQAASMEANPEKRFAMLREAEAIVTEQDFPFIPLYQYGGGYMYDPDKLANLDLNVKIMILFKWLKRK